MSSEDNKILEFYKYEKSDKTPFIVYGDLECIIKKTDGSKNNPENVSATKVSEHIPSGFSMSTKSSFRSIENNCMKKSWESLREHVMKIINFKKKEVKLLKKEQNESYESIKTAYNCKEKIKNKYLKSKVIIKLEIIVIIQGNREVLLIAYVIWNIMYLKKFP